MVLLLLNGGDAAKLDPLSKNSANLHAHAGKVWPEACVVPTGSTLARPPGRPPRGEEMVALPLGLSVVLMVLLLLCTALMEV